MPTVKCQNCQKEFHVKPFEIKVGWGKYCSKKCQHIFRQGKKRIGNYPIKKYKNIICHHCGKIFKCNDWITRKNAKFCSVKCKRFNRSSEHNFGKKKIDGDGYESIYLPMHPFSNNGSILYHRFLVEQYLRKFNPKSEFLITLGKNVYLSPLYIVHHIDGNILSNYLSNFYICLPSKHTFIHRSKNKPEIKCNFLTL